MQLPEGTAQRDLSHHREGQPYQGPLFFIEDIYRNEDSGTKTTSICRVEQRGKGSSRVRPLQRPAEWSLHLNIWLSTNLYMYMRNYLSSEEKNHGKQQVQQFLQLTKGWRQCMTPEYKDCDTLDRGHRWVSTYWWDYADLGLC